MDISQALDNVYLLYQKNGYDRTDTIVFLVNNFEFTTEVADELLTVVIKRQLAIQKKNRISSARKTILSKY